MITAPIVERWKRVQAALPATEYVPVEVLEWIFFAGAAAVYEQLCIDCEELQQLLHTMVKRQLEENHKGVM